MLLVSVWPGEATTAKRQPAVTTPQSSTDVKSVPAATKWRPLWTKRKGPCGGYLHIKRNLKTTKVYDEASTSTTSQLQTEIMAETTKNTTTPTAADSPPPAGGERLVGFGKHSDLTFQALAETQRGYVHWLFRQSWFQSKYPDLYEYMDAVGLRPEITASTILEGDVAPVDHNTFQARFTDDNELLHLVQSILGKEHNYNITNVTFEHLCNADIVVDVECRAKNAGWFSGTQYFTLLIELKPSVSNDYPEILRQMRTQHRSYNYFTTAPKTNPVIQQALVTRAYTGKVDIEAVRKMFGEIQIVEVTPNPEPTESTEVPVEETK